MPAVGGFVFDSAGAPVDRELRIYRRDTGALLGKTRSSGGDGDPHFDKVSLLLHCDGADGSTALVNSGPTPITITSDGAAKITTAQSRFGGASLDTTNPSGTYGTAAAPANTPSLIFGTGDFTVELFVRSSVSLQTIDYPRLVAVGEYLTSGGWNLVFLKPDGGQLFLDFYASGGVALGLPCGTLTDNTWHHVAFARSGTTVRTFLDGVQQGSGTSGLNLSATVPFKISSGFRGFFDEIRITKGVARYTASFTPPGCTVSRYTQPRKSHATGRILFCNHSHRRGAGRLHG